MDLSKRWSLHRKKVRAAPFKKVSHLDGRHVQPLAAFKKQSRETVALSQPEKRKRAIVEGESSLILLHSNRILFDIFRRKGQRAHLIFYRSNHENIVKILWFDIQRCQFEVENKWSQFELPRIIYLVVDSIHALWCSCQIFPRNHHIKLHLQQCKGPKTNWSRLKKKARQAVICIAN